MLTVKPYRFARAATSVAIPVASLLLLWKMGVSSAWAVSGVSPSAPGEQVLSPAAQKHAQGPEGPSPGVQRVTAGGRPRRNSSDEAHSPGRGRLLLGCSLCRARPPWPSVCISLRHANTTMCSQ
eukprot:XP_001708475.1 Hypothetical protein GL50803_99065 [Giardia lamblia ATCC 50803]